MVRTQRNTSTHHRIRAHFIQTIYSDARVTDAGVRKPQGGASHAETTGAAGAGRGSTWWQRTVPRTPRAPASGQAECLAVNTAPDAAAGAPQYNAHVAR